jgi:hypothetical protein
MPNGLPKRGTMREENPTPNNTTGPKTEKVPKLSDRPTGIPRDSIFDNLALYEHDYREVNGTRIHDYQCRRCALTVRLNGLRNKLQILVREVNQIVGQMNPD